MPSLAKGVNLLTELNTFSLHFSIKNVHKRVRVFITAECCRAGPDNTLQLSEYITRDQRIYKFLFNHAMLHDNLVY